MGIWNDALRKVTADKAPEILQRLKDDRAGKIKLTATQKKAAMIILRRVMTATQIKAELDTVAHEPGKKKAAKKVKGKR